MTPTKPFDSLKKEKELVIYIKVLFNTVKGKKILVN